MAEIVLNTRFQLKRGNSSAWTKNNPILYQGEPGYEIDTGLLKIGDGITSWNDLDYFIGDVYTKDEIDTMLSNTTQFWETF